MNHTNMHKNSGMVMVFALLILLSLTILGVTSVASSLMQSKMAVSMERSSLAFDAAESAIAGVIFEAEDKVVLADANINDPLSDARGGNQLDLTVQSLSCFEENDWTNRSVTSAGLSKGSRHVGTGDYVAQPAIDSWSKTAFLREQPCVGSSNVIGGSNISCHVFIVRGCGQLKDSNFVVANTLNASVFAPAAQ
ncbi:MAG: pilus assembly protein PilZ [Paraglaciecola sp.]|uniref:PilX N-terminal domain-containing pilus assembly protein n=1 Tax=Pseudomonadati TaxID=3379134 RepID=UPI00273FFC62|nr:PilX N-terminal domain-containing pilus assembly protein [Paraglaciecola sp.]MDP5031476.1 pilus assembly protein PilZ [Paraglaciecola sp.]MDP5130821.1 pilus assembly protein PilZ [Paraglaciecola sp.]